MPDTAYPARGARSFATGVNALSTTAEEIAAARAGRTRFLVKNIDSTITVYVGEDNGVGAADGLELLAGESVALYTTGAIWAEAASGTPSISFLDEYESTP